MRVLFIAGRDPDSLMIQREITLLQQRAISAAGEDVTFHFLTDISLEDLALELSRQRPDVLHISAHGTAVGFEFANSSGNLVVLKPQALLSLLHPEHSPRLIYLNGCKSSDAANQMLDSSQMAIGSTQLITNRAAMAAAVLFYDRLIGGFTVQKAFDAAQAMIHIIQADTASADLFARPGVLPAHERLHQVPRIVAEMGLSTKTVLEIEFGLIGCRHDTVQVVFFVDDEDFIMTDDEDALETDLCLVVRQRPIDGVIWSVFFWESSGDFRIYACATTSAGFSYSVASTVCEAVEAKQMFFDQVAVDKIPEKVVEVLSRLRAANGSRMSPRGLPRTRITPINKPLKEVKAGIPKKNK